MISKNSFDEICCICLKEAIFMTKSNKKKTFSFPDIYVYADSIHSITYRKIHNSLNIMACRL